MSTQEPHTPDLDEAGLLPCPFCNDRENMHIADTTPPGCVWVQCDTCGAEGPGQSKTRVEAIAAWNRRATTAGDPVASAHYDYEQGEYTPISVGASTAHPSPDIDPVREAAQALMDDVNRRYPGEELYCPYMRHLDAALSAEVERPNWTAIYEGCGGVSVGADHLVAVTRESLHLALNALVREATQDAYPNQLAAIRELRAALSAAPAGGESLLCWVPEDELPQSMTQEAYNALHDHSRVDGIRWFPVFGPACAAPAGEPQNVDDLVRRVGDAVLGVANGPEQEIYSAVRRGLESAPAGGEVERYVVWSNRHRAWWNPDRAGYTRRIEEAGVYSRDEALMISHLQRDGWLPNELPDEIAVRVSDLPEFARAALNEGGSDDPR